MDFAKARRNMVESQIRPSNVTGRELVSAMLEIPRERFVPSSRRNLAYIDEDIIVREGDDGSPRRWLMEPMPFARLVQLADVSPGDIVLDVGCATGYSTAVLARLADSVVGLESDGGLAAAADATLVDLGIGNAAIVTGDLAEGCPSQAPFDVIVLEGAVETIPDALFSQLREGGRLVAVVSDGPVGKATLFRSVDGDISSRVAFDAAVRPLPGFQRPQMFTF